MRTGDIHNLDELELKKANENSKMKMQRLSDNEAEHLKAMPKEQRVLEYELANYMKGRPQHKGLMAASIRYAFRAGFNARAKVDE